ncbi:flagellar protein FlaG [Pontibacterium granulatum]|uniref:flagellar protein FlaG n=1 Tax=Pontibacterium granulatum TaxID=2036029 RepID=UPI00249B2618|nr:flagellar protein FlaG [Pontibacterium granulatum]MDI3322908.1 flagellar protein FlaG [Pontibacterium granulatum]
MAIESASGANTVVSSIQQASQQQNVQAQQAQQVEQANPTEQNKDRVQATIQENEQVSAEDLEAAIERLNELMKDGQRSLNFSVDKELEEVVIKVTDTETEELIRQIPNEEALKFAKNLEGVLGVIFNDRA